MKMDDSVKSGAGLEVSVSFGRFDNDELSWEKWSSFSQNKYMEEIGTLSTPGSVAQKKAYFEAHYKKIAAKKAEEELEQEKSMGPVIPSPDSEDDAFAKSSENSTEFGFSGGDRLAEDVTEEHCITCLKNVAIMDEEEEDDARSFKEGEHGACTNGFVDVKMLEVEIECAPDSVQSESSVVEEAKDVMNVNIDKPELKNEHVFVRSEVPQKDSQRILKEPPERKNGVKQTKKETPKLNARSKIASKVTPTRKEKVLAGTKKQVVSPAVKPLQASTPKPSKPTLVSTPVSASQSLKKKVNASAPPKSKISHMRESKRAPPTSLHMSLSLGPSDSLSSLPMTRKSLIMESMGDKDIVRRAFKTFQNRSNGSINDGKPTTVKNVPSTSFEPKMSSYHTPTKGNEGPRKDAEKRFNQRSQAGSKSNPLPSGSHKSLGVPKKSPMPISPATGLRSDEKAEKRKEFLKKLEAKSIARMAENAQPGARSTVSVENGIRQRPTLKR